jgi:hypothetical protein
LVKASDLAQLLVKASDLAQLLAKASGLAQLHPSRCSRPRSLYFGLMSAKLSDSLSALRLGEMMAAVLGPPSATVLLSHFPMVALERHQR